ncbi:hypothetical protein FRB98_007264, partial [Tulasnella sp. 332]
FATFLRPIPFPFLLRAANEGPVVVVNISEIQSDVIINLSGAEPEIFQLSNAMFEEIGRIASMTEGAVGEGRNKSAVDEVLRLSWAYIVQRVVERLEAMCVVRGSHIWWCPTSRLCSLPLSAASIYRAKQPKLPGTPLSSYTSTLSTLVRAHSRSSTSLGRPSIFAIGVPQPDGRDGADGALQLVGEELQRLLVCVPDEKLMEGHDATRNAVLKQLPFYSLVHPSCHGHQGVNGPFHSRFRLQDKSLYMQETIRTDLPNVELAFLSACHTATGDRMTPYQGLHLSASKQFAGFRSVVGTLWAMDDVEGPDMTESFYGYMLRNGGEASDYKDAAKGVHEISKVLRRKKAPLHRWINFIHVGA